MTRKMQSCLNINQKVHKKSTEFIQLSSKKWFKNKVNAQNNRLTVRGGYGAVRSIEYLEKNGMWEKSPDPLEKDFA